MTDCYGLGNKHQDDEIDSRFFVELFCDSWGNYDGKCDCDYDDDDDGDYYGDDYDDDDDEDAEYDGSHVNHRSVINDYPASRLGRDFFINNHHEEVLHCCGQDA